MKKYMPKLIIMAALVAKAVVEIIPDYSQPMLLTAAIPLVILAFLLFKNVNASISFRIPWIAAVAVIIFYVLPLGPLSMDILSQLPRYLTILLEAVALSSGPGALALVILIPLQLFFRKRKNIIFIVLRYLLLWVVFDALRGEMFYMTKSYYAGIIALIVCCGFAREAMANLQDMRRPSFLRSLLLLIGAMLVYQIFGTRGSYDLNNLFQLNQSSWYISMTVALILGILCLVDDYQCYGGDVFTRCYSGWLLVLWGLLLALMRLFSGLFNQDILLIGYPLVCVMLSQWVTGYQNQSKNSNTKLNLGNQSDFLFGSLFYMILFLMLLAKSINQGLLVQWVLMAVALVMTLNWKIILTGKLKRRLLDLFLGIVVMLLLVTTKMTDWVQFLADPALLISVVLCGVLWVLISGQVHRLAKNASPVFPEEFQDAKVLCTTLPLILLGFWAIQMFFIL